MEELFNLYRNNKLVLINAKLGMISKILKRMHGTDNVLLCLGFGYKIVRSK